MAKKQLPIAKTEERMELLEDLRVKLGQSTFSKTIDTCLRITKHYLKHRKEKKEEFNKELPPIKEFKE